MSEHGSDQTPSTYSESGARAEVSANPHNSDNVSGMGSDWRSEVTMTTEADEGAMQQLVTTNGSADNSHDDYDMDVDDADDDGDDDAVPSNDISVENSAGEGDLIRAVRANDCNLIRNLVHCGSDCNALWKETGQPCTVRVMRDEFRKIMQMTGYAPLHVAAIHSSLKTIKCLLSLGADINLRDKNDRTALQLAVTVDRTHVARFFIGAGSEINTQSSSGRSPLLEAVTNLNVDITQMLLSAGADANLADKKGSTPLYTAVGSMAFPTDNTENGMAILKCLINAGCEVDRTNRAGASPLMWAASLKNTEVIQTLLAAGANVNLTDRAGLTPFSMAIEGRRSIPIVKILMQHGAATHMADNRGETPLSKSLKFGSMSVLRLLLASDAAPHTYDILNAPRIIQLRQYLPEFNEWLHKELYEPRSLCRLCREVIRCRLSPHNLSQVDNLDLPRTLSAFILGETD